jgi:hypothetical protein
MRSYAPYDRTKQSSQSGKKKERAERYSNEWDVRIDCDGKYADEIVNNLKNATAVLEYGLVSGIEMPDKMECPHDGTGPRGGSKHYGSQETHIHIALVFKYQLRRDQVLAHCRGLLKKTDEYAVPRNRKFVYAGWFMHHTKMDVKLVHEQSIKWEYGLLPLDGVDEDRKKMVVRMFNKFGKDTAQSEEENRKRFQLWLE